MCSRTEATALACCPRLSDLGKPIQLPCSVSEPWPDQENTHDSLASGLCKKVTPWHFKLVFQGFNMRKDTVCPVSNSSNCGEALRELSNTSERSQSSGNLLSSERAWCSISVWANQPKQAGIHAHPAWQICWHACAHTHTCTNEARPTWYISEHGEELIRPHPVSLTTAVTERKRPDPLARERGLLWLV